MHLFVLSDLHLDEDSGARLFRDSRQGLHLARLLERIGHTEGAELVLLGDTFDFTAMTPPPRGLEEFERRVKVELRTQPRRAVPTMLEAIARANPRAIAALKDVSQRRPVTVAVGNHDRQLAEPEAPGAIASLGIRARIVHEVVRELAGYQLVMQHGHLWDGANAKPHGVGEAVTNILNQAVIPFIHAQPPRAHVRTDADRVVAMRPEERIIPMLQRWYEPAVFKRFFRALIHLIADNIDLPRPVEWVTRWVSPERVHRAAEKQDPRWTVTGHRAQRALEGKLKLPNRAPRPDLYVLGHTHVLDWLPLPAERRRPERLYVNLGTWTERTYDVASPPDQSMPLLEIREERDRVVVSLSDLDDPPEELQRFEVKRRD